MPNIPKSKGNQTKKFGQLIEHTKCDGATSPRHFSGKLKLRIYLDQ